MHDASELGYNGVRRESSLVSPFIKTLILLNQAFCELKCVPQNLYVEDLIPPDSYIEALTSTVAIWERES